MDAADREFLDAIYPGVEETSSLTEEQWCFLKEWKPPMPDKLTREQILALQGRELDLAVYESLKPSYVRKRLYDGYLRYKAGADQQWSPSTDIAAAYAVEKELQRRGLHGQYASVLCGLLWPTGAGDVEHPWEDWYRVLHADCPTRCRAALLTVEGV